MSRWEGRSRAGRSPGVATKVFEDVMAHHERANDSRSKQSIYIWTIICNFDNIRRYHFCISGSHIKLTARCKMLHNLDDFVVWSMNSESL